MGVLKDGKLCRKLVILLAVLAFMTVFSAGSVCAASLTPKLKSDCRTTVTKGTTIHLTGQASGGSGTKKYRFIVAYNGTKTVIQKYSRTRTVSFTPNATGTYKVYLTVKDKSGKVTISVTFTVKEDVNTLMTAARNKVLAAARSWLGSVEGGTNHQAMLKLYNSVRSNVYRSWLSHYNASVSDDWCDIFVSAVFIRAGYASLSGVECGCEEHIWLLKAKGCFVEDDSYVPAPGDIIFYDWSDYGSGDCTGWADHVGIVYKVSNGWITTIEGNYNDRVGSRKIQVNASKIRGYGVPYLAMK